MPMRLPVSLDVEYRGVKPSRDYTIRETGERRTAAPVLKFECEKPDGDIEVIEVAGSTLDRMVPSVDYSKFRKGERYTLTGVAVIQDRGSDWDSYFGVESCRPAGSAAKPATAP